MRRNVWSSLRRIWSGDGVACLAKGIGSTLHTVGPMSRGIFCRFCAIGSKPRRKSLRSRHSNTGLPKNSETSDRFFAFGHVLRIFLVVVMVVTLFAVVFGTLWSTAQIVNRFASVEQQIQTMERSSIETEKLRQEAIALRLDNEQTATFLTTFLASIGKFITTVGTTVVIAISLLGAWVGVRQYLDVRAKEASELEKQRFEREAEELTRLWQGLSSTDEIAKAASIAGLRSFIGPEKSAYHARLAEAAALVGRMSAQQVEEEGRGESLILHQTGKLLVESVMRNLPDVLREQKLSWQGIKLRRANLSDCNLADFDFRDTDLRETDFTDANLTRARFHNAQLQGCIFKSAILPKASLEYADLAGADFRGADLTNSDLSDIKLLGMDIEGANLRGARLSLDPEKTDWSLSKNWRMAKDFDPGVRKELEEMYGPMAVGNKILMLMWEFPPFVSGGGWTAAFHLVRSLRRKGYDIAIMIPWLESQLGHLRPLRRTFGYEIEIFCAGIGIPSYGNYSALSPSSYSEYGMPSTYDTGYSMYSSAYSAHSDVYRRKPIMHLVNMFADRARRIIREKRVAFDMIHAHDWLTFEAAQSLADYSGKPWLAHFHSTERGRRGERSSFAISRVEQYACEQSNKIAVPSQILRESLITEYRVDESKIDIVPNNLSEKHSALASVGIFSPPTVIFVGRLAWQKGPDLFVKIARRVRERCPMVAFRIYGQGDSERTQRRLMASPNSMQFDPLDDLQDETSVDEYPFRFSRLQPISIRDDGSMERLREMTNGAREREQWKLWKGGFTMTSLEFEDPYEYRVVAFGGAQYLACTDVLPESDASERFVAFEGFKDWEDRFEAYKGATVVVVPSRSEPFGMVVLEAMQSGVPVMFEKSAGVGEVVSSGIRFDANDIEAAADILINLLDSEEYWYQIADEELREMNTFHLRNYEDRFAEIWSELSDGIGQETGLNRA
jgi:glycosyltransferase involved in cell wall biosynthesis